MTAEAEEAAAAAAAVDLGMQLSAQYHDAAGASPGNGLAVALPRDFDSMGATQGLGFGIPADQPALRKPAEAPWSVPSYPAEAVGRLGHHSTTPGEPTGLDGVAWPSRADALSRSTIAYVGRGGSKSASAPSRVKAARNRARRSLRGRSGK